MFRALWTSASGMTAQQTNLLVYQTIREPGAPTSPTTRNPSGFQVGLGAYVSDTYGIFTQGNIFQTGNQLDIAIQGDGFFKVVLPDGTIVNLIIAQRTFEFNTKGITEADEMLGQTANLRR